MSDVLVLCYHAVSPNWTAELSLAPQQLERQLRALLRRGYRGATFSAAVNAPAGGKTLAVTFDDAYRSVAEIAAPILARLGLPGTVFAPTDFVGRSGPMSWPGIDQWLDGEHEHELRPMSWAELAALADAGWEVGSHTCSHPRLTALDDGALARELRDSAAACADALGRPCSSIAYPYGDVDERVIEAAAGAGYRAGAALPARWHSARALCWPRPGIYHGDGTLRFAAKASPLVRRLRRIASR